VKASRDTSAAGSRIFSLSLNRHEWNSCPSRWFFLRQFFISGKWKLGKARVPLVPIATSPKPSALAGGGRFRWKNSRVVATAMLAACSMFPTRFSAQVDQRQAERDASLKKFLREYAGKPWPEFEKENKTRYSAAFVDLAGDGTRQVIVYLTGRGWCGSGGCVTLVLSRSDSSYELVTTITVSRPPIRILNSKSNGWKDITVQVAGGGVAAHEAKLSFNGKTYPSNPSVPPAASLDENVPGNVVIRYEEQGTSLYE
jgi:hypothetical protein